MFLRKTAIPAVLALILATFLPMGASLAQESRSLSLMDALKIALENNLDLVSARYTPQLAEQDIEIQESNFDIGLEAQVRHSEQVQAATQSSTLSGSTVDNGSVGIQQNMKFGGSYTASLVAVRQEQSGINVLAPTSYFSSLSFNFNIPLLNGLGVEDTTEQLILSRNALEVSLWDLEGSAEAVVQSVEGAYWDMVAARENLRISRLSLKRAKDQLALNRKKVEVGTLAPIEITQAEAEVASQEENVILAETGQWDAEDEMRRLMGVPETDPMWDQELVPDDLPDYREVQVDLNDALEQAMTHRSDIYAARQTVRDRELSEKIAHRGVRHQLDFDGGYTPTGASLPVIDFTDPLNPVVLENPSLADSFANLPDLDQFSWNAQFTYRVPIGNRHARANYARSRISTRQAGTELANLEQSIRVEVRKAARAVESGVKRVQAAKVNTVLQEKKLDAEQKKFENGMSTSFEVLTFQRDLANAELARVRALLDYAKSLTALEKAKGTLMEARGLSL